MNALPVRHQTITWIIGDKYFWCYLASLGHNELTHCGLWRHRSGSTLVQVMACCLTAPSHYLNQCWLIISRVQWRQFHERYLSHQSLKLPENYWSMILLKSPRGQWVKVIEAAMHHPSQCVKFLWAGAWFWPLILNICPFEIRPSSSRYAAQHYCLALLNIDKNMPGNGATK